MEQWNNRIMCKWVAFICVLFVFFFAFSISASAQSSSGTKIDSLLAKLKTASGDAKGEILNEISKEYKLISQDSSIKYAKHALVIAQSLDNKKIEAEALNNLGTAYYYQNDFQKSLENYQRALKIKEELGDKKSVAKILQTIGVIYHRWSDFEQALKYYQKSLKINEELQNKEGIAATVNTIGVVYLDWKNYDKAEEYFKQSLDINEQLHNNNGIADASQNLGLVYYSIEGIKKDEKDKNYEKAIKYYKKALAIYKTLDNKRSIALSLNSIGAVYHNQKNYTKALEYFQKSYEINEAIGYKYGMILSLSCIGNIYTESKDLRDYYKALQYYDKSLQIAKSINHKETIKANYRAFSEVFDSLRDYKKSLEYYRLYSDTKDSIFNESRNKIIEEMQTKYETEKKEKEIQLKDLEISRQLAVSSRQRVIIFFVVCVLLLVVVFAVFIYRLFVQKKKANILLAEQQKEITDSIQYAKRIQTAILPSEDYIKMILPEHFILNKPKSIVSGDFYWATKIKHWLIFAVVDCTGHGVPGGFMSMLGMTFLNEIVKKEEVMQANHILNYLREYIIKSLQQRGIAGEQKDGMDASLCVLNTETMILQYAGANNPLYLIPNHSTKEKGERKFSKSRHFGKPDLSGQSGVGLCGVEFLPDKMPIAIHNRLDEFKNNEIQLNKGDILYLFSDGYADQFGGTNNKKFMTKRFKELLLSIHNKPMSEQKEILAHTFEEWKGANEQIDDVCVMGIRI